MSDVAILIPALDCAATIDAVVSGARRYAQTLVVDDGSADDTAARAEAAGAVVLRTVHRGKGAALREGMRWLLSRGVTRALTMDADGEHLTTEIPALLAASADDPEALIIGARRIGAQRVAPTRRLANRAADFVVAMVCGLHLSDTQCGFRVYPLRTILDLNPRGGHFAFETEVLIRAARSGIRVRAVPVDVYYPPPRERISHYRAVVDTLRILAVIASLVVAPSEPRRGK